MENTSQLNYGSIHRIKKGNSYQVYFQHPIFKKKYLGCFEKEKAEKALKECLFEFYSENSFLLPKGIWVSKNTKDYRFGIVINNKTKHIFISDDLKEVVDYRIKFINSLLF